MDLTDPNGARYQAAPRPDEASIPQAVLARVCAPRPAESACVHPGQRDTVRHIWGPGAPGGRGSVDGDELQADLTASAAPGTLEVTTAPATLEGVTEAMLDEALCRLGKLSTTCRVSSDRWNAKAHAGG